MAQAWYMYPDDTGTGQYGSFPDPADSNLTKPDDNVCVPSIVPITHIMGNGTVSDVSWGKAWSGSVTIQLDNPPNSFARYCAYNFLTSISVQRGERVHLGSVIGFPGQAICAAFGLTNASPWGAGYFGHAPGAADPRLDPRPIIQAARKGNFTTSGISGNPLSSIGSAFTAPAQAFVSVSNATHNTLNNIPGFLGIVEALDIAEQFQPFSLPDNSNSVIGKIPIIGGILQPITIPADAMQALLTFVTANTLAFIIRAIIVFIGLMIIIALIRNALNAATVATTGQTSGQLAASAVRIGATAGAI